MLPIWSPIAFKPLHCSYLASSVTLQATIFSMPQAESTFTTTVLSPASNKLSISDWTFLSSSVGSPCALKHGKFKSSFVVPSSCNKLTSPESPSALSNWYSWFFTIGTLKLWEVGHKSSYFLPVKNQEYQLLNADGDSGEVSLLQEDGTTKDDARPRPRDL